MDSRSKRWKCKALIRVIVLCSWTRHLNVTVHIPSQEFRWIPANEWGKRQIVTLGGIYCRPAFLSRGVAIFLVVSCFRNRDICHLSSVKTFFSVDGCVLMTFFFSLNSLNMFHCTWSGLLWVFSRKNRKKRKKKR